MIFVLVIDLEIFLKFNKIRKLTQSIEDIQKALSRSEFLELSEDKMKLCRKLPLKIKENEDNCTIYVERIKSDTTHDWLTTAFSEFGKVVYVSVPKYKQSNVNKGFAFIEFEQPHEAQQALTYFENINCKISSQLPPDELCSINTHEEYNKSSKANLKDELTVTETTNKHAEINEIVDESSKKKRKRSEEREAETEKKLKVVDESKDEAIEDRKKAKKGNKKKCQFKEMRLKIMSKLVHIIFTLDIEMIILQF